MRHINHQQELPEFEVQLETQEVAFPLQSKRVVAAAKNSIVRSMTTSLAGVGARKEFLNRNGKLAEAYFSSIFHSNFFAKETILEDGSLLAIHFRDLSKKSNNRFNIPDRKLKLELYIAQPKNPVGKRYLKDLFDKGGTKYMTTFFILHNPEQCKLLSEESIRKLEAKMLKFENSTARKKSKIAPFILDNNNKEEVENNPQQQDYIFREDGTSNYPKEIPGTFTFKPSTPHVDEKTRQTYQGVDLNDTGVINVSNASYADSKMQIAFRSICPGNAKHKYESEVSTMTDFSLSPEPTPNVPLLTKFNTSRGNIADATDNDGIVAKGMKHTLLNTSQVPGGGKLIIEFCPVTKTGLAGSVDDNMWILSSQGGDYKFNVILEWPGYDDALIDENDIDEGDSFFYLDIDYVTNKGIRKADDDDCKYYIDERDAALYVPNQYYISNRDGKMEVQTMEAGYPRLSSMRDDGSQTFTLQFRKSSRVFYDPGYQEQPNFHRAFVKEAFFSLKKGKVAADTQKIANWMTTLVGVDALQAISMLNGNGELVGIDFSSSSHNLYYSDTSILENGSLLAISCKDVSKNARFDLQFFRGSYKARNLEFELAIIEPSNTAGKEYLVDLRSRGAKYIKPICTLLDYRSCDLDAATIAMLEAQKAEFERQRIANLISPTASLSERSEDNVPININIQDTQENNSHPDFNSPEQLPDPGNREDGGNGEDRGNGEDGGNGENGENGGNVSPFKNVLCLNHILIALCIAISAMSSYLFINYILSGEGEIPSEKWRVPFLCGSVFCYR